jgi:hypothetical protein
MSNRNGACPCGKCGYKANWPSRSKCYECGAWLGVAAGKPRKPQGAWAKGQGTGQANGHWQTAREKKWVNYDSDGGVHRAMANLGRDEAIKDTPELLALNAIVAQNKKAKNEAKPVHVRARAAQDKVAKKETQISKCRDRITGLEAERHAIDLKLADEQFALVEKQAELSELTKVRDAFDDEPPAATPKCAFKVLENAISGVLVGADPTMDAVLQGLLLLLKQNTAIVIPESPLASVASSAHGEESEHGDDVSMGGLDDETAFDVRGIDLTITENEERIAALREEFENRIEAEHLSLRQSKRARATRLDDAKDAGARNKEREDSKSRSPKGKPAAEGGEPALPPLPPLPALVLAPKKLVLAPKSATKIVDEA